MGQNFAAARYSSIKEMLPERAPLLLSAEDARTSSSSSSSSSSSASANLKKGIVAVVVSAVGLTFAIASSSGKNASLVSGQHHFLGRIHRKRTPETRPSTI